MDNLTHYRCRNVRATLGLFTVITVMTGAFGCSEITNDLSDHIPPIVKLAKQTGVDTTILFNATVTDNLGIKRVHIVTSGGVVATLDTVFTSALTSVAIPYTLSVPRTVSAGTLVTIVGTAYDGAGNASIPDTLKVAVGNVAPGVTTITIPASGTVIVQGKSVVLAISANRPLKVRGIGYQTSGSFVAADSTIFTSPLLDSTAVAEYADHSCDSPDWISGRHALRTRFTWATHPWDADYAHCAITERLGGPARRQFWHHCESRGGRYRSRRSRRPEWDHISRLRSPSHSKHKRNATNSYRR